MNALRDTMNTQPSPQQPSTDATTYSASPFRQPGAPIPIPAPPRLTRIVHLNAAMALAAVGLFVWGSRQFNQLETLASQPRTEQITRDALESQHFEWPVCTISVLVVVVAFLGTVIGHFARNYLRVRTEVRGDKHILALLWVNYSTLVFGVLLGLSRAFASFSEITFGGFGNGFGWGRPFRLRGRAAHAPVIEGETWSLAMEPDSSNLTFETRRLLADAWLQDARTEHASVSAFAQLTLDLIAVGAPASLVEKTHRASMEEIDHARRCFAMASRYAGRALSPGRWVEAGGSRTARALDKIAVDSAIDGCVLEAYAAATARSALETSTDPAVRELLSIIARDEQSHADLAWEMLQWCVAQGGEKVRLQVERSLARLPDEAPASLLPPGWSEDPASAGHGRVSPQTAQACYRATLQLARARMAVLRAQRRAA